MKLINIAKVAAALSLALAPMAVAAPDALQGRDRELNGQLEQITSAGEQLRSTRLLTARDFEVSPDQAYASGMYDIFIETAGNAKLASDSKGARGDVQGLRLFEDLAEVHEATLGREVGNNDDFMARIRSGEVLIDPKYVATWSPRDRAGFKAFLSPSAVRAYPSLVSVTPAAMPQAFAASELTGQACSVALPCITPCINKNWAACAACIGKAIPTAKAAYSKFLSCWNGAGKPKWTPLFVWRAKCLAAFIKVLA